MKRLFRSSCLGLLAILIFGIVTILSVLAVVFQQSQAVTSNVVATTEARATPTRRAQLPTLALSGGLLDGDVTIQVDARTPGVVPNTATLIAPTNAGLSTPTLSFNTLLPSATGTDVPRYSGTSS